MTARRIFATAKPSLIGARVLPMSKADTAFWQRLAERRAQSLTRPPVGSGGAAAADRATPPVPPQRPGEGRG